MPIFIASILKSFNTDFNCDLITLGKIGKIAEIFFVFWLVIAVITVNPSARRGIATDEMKQVAKDEDVTLDWLIPKVASGSIIIPSNNVRKEKIHNVGIGKGMKTKVNVNIGTSTLNVNFEEEIEKAKVAVKYHADTIMDLSDGGDVGIIRRKLLKNF